MTTFTVNGAEYTLLPLRLRDNAVEFCEETPLTYEHIVKLAGLTGDPIVVFRQRDGEWTRSGFLHKGQTMTDLRPGTRFTVCHTGNA